MIFVRPSEAEEILEKSWKQHAKEDMLHAKYDEGATVASYNEETREATLAALGCRSSKASGSEVPAMSEVLRVDAEKLQVAVAAIMEKEGVAPQDAAIVADSLVSAELTRPAVPRRAACEILYRQHGGPAVRIPGAG